MVSISNFGSKLLLLFAFYCAKGKGVSGHFNFDLLVCWYAHGDRCEATASARPGESGYIEHCPGVRICNFKLGRLADRRPTNVTLASLTVVPNRVRRELNLVTSAIEAELGLNGPAPFQLFAAQVCQHFS